jgi:hypothetical protein
LSSSSSRSLVAVGFAVSKLRQKAEKKKKKKKERRKRKTLLLLPPSSSSSPPIAIAAKEHHGQSFLLLLLLLRLRHGACSAIALRVKLSRTQRTLAEMAPP